MVLAPGTVVQSDDYAPDNTISTNRSNAKNGPETQGISSGMFGQVSV